MSLPHKPRSDDSEANLMHEFSSVRATRRKAGVLGAVLRKDFVEMAANVRRAPRRLSESPCPADGPPLQRTSRQSVA